MEKKLRIKSPSDFKKTFKEGRRFLSPRFVLYMRKNALKTARIGVSISKSHFKLATRRNRLRRIAKELFRKEIAPNLKGYDLVVASRAYSKSSNFNEIIKGLKALILKAKE